MLYRRAAILYNPAAGGGLFQTAPRVDQAADVLRRFVAHVELSPTQTHRRADALARQAVARGCDLIAPYGGDGTINEALQGIQGSNAVLLPLPAGTANVFARETGLPLDPVRVASLLPQLVARRSRLGVVEFPRENRNRYFLLMCGAGVDANTVHRLNAELKRRLGIFAYVWSGLQQLVRRFEPLHLQLEGERLDSTLAVISKSRLYGGSLVLTPDAHLLEDRFDVVCFRSRSPLRYTGHLAEALTHTLGRFSGVARRRSDHVELRSPESPEVWVQVDGELAGRLPADVRMAGERVWVLAPAAYWARRPHIPADPEAPRAPAVVNG